MIIVNRKQYVIEGLLYRLTILADGILTAVIHIVQINDSLIRFVEAILVLKVLLLLLLLQSSLPLIKRNIIVVVLDFLIVDINIHGNIDYSPERLEIDIDSLLI